MVWAKRRWACAEPLCGETTWTEQRPDIAPVRAVLTARAGMWGTREIGAEVHTVAYVARQLGVSWHTVMDAVRYWGQALIEDPARIDKSRAVGVDETKFLAAKRCEPTRWVSTICDVARRVVVDVIEGRQGPELEVWLARQPEAWCHGVEVTVTDLHEPFRKALAGRLPNATAVADAFHVVVSAPGWSIGPAAGYNKRLSATGATSRIRSTGVASCSQWPRNASTAPARPSCAVCSPPVIPTGRSTRTCRKRTATPWAYDQQHADARRGGSISVGGARQWCRVTVAVARRVLSNGV